MVVARWDWRASGERHSKPKAIDGAAVPTEMADVPQAAVVEEDNGDDNGATGRGRGGGGGLHPSHPSARPGPPPRPIKLRRGKQVTRQSKSLLQRTKQGRQFAVRWVEPTDRIASHRLAPSSGAVASAVPVSTESTSLEWSTPNGWRKGDFAGSPPPDTCQSVVNSCGVPIDPK